MSVLINEAYANPSTPLWATGSGNPPTLIALNNETLTEVIIADIGVFQITNITFPTLPYDVNYFCYGIFNLNSAGIDTGDFTLELSGTSVIQTTGCNFKANKGWFSMNLAVVSPCPAGIDGETIGLYINNNSGAEITVSGNATLYVVAYPV